jgi:hypothetical protein
MCRKDEIKAVVLNDPWRIDEIRQLEADTKDVLEKNLAKKGKTLEDVGYSIGPKFFQARDSHERNKPWPIDKVAEWAQTSRGGKQFELFHTSEPGCQMWGLCDIGPNDDD